MVNEGNGRIKLKSVSRSTLSKQVVERIVQMLTSGQMKPGDRLPSEMELIEDLGVSRPILREALSALEILEIITRKTREGTFFNEKVGSHPFSVMLALSANNLPAIVEARMTLELGLVTLAAEKITDDQLNELKETIDAIANSKDNDYGEIDKEFHRIIALSANSSVFEGMIHSLLVAHDKTDREIKYRERERTVKHHTAIYNALANHDPYEAYKQMYHHLNYVRQKVSEHYLV